MRTEFRAVRDSTDVDRFLTLPYSLNHEIVDDLDAKRRRTSWMWIAVDEGELVARVAWWSSPDSERPELLDIFDVRDPADPSDVAAAFDLLQQATATTLGDGPRPGYLRYVRPDGRDHPGARCETAALIDLVERTGARLFVERLRLEWRAGTPIPTDTGRLRFRRPHNDREVLALMTAVVDGTLDAHTRLDLETMSAADAARKHLGGELAAQVSPRHNWRVATDHESRPVGFVTPGRNHYHPVIGYLAVLPAYRGRGYIDDILAAGTRVLADQGVDHIRAATDLTNTPMAHAFARQGWIEFERSINMTWSTAAVSHGAGVDRRRSGRVR